MTIVPNLKNYTVEVLAALGNETNEEEFRNRIKELIVNKILGIDSAMFYLLSKFMKESKILKEAYARVILIRLQKEDYPVDNSIIDEILTLVSLDDLIQYGANARSLELSRKCTELFWAKVVEMENISELNKKNTRYRRRLLVEKLKMER